MTWRRTSCIDCGAPIAVMDWDELAICLDCLEERADAGAQSLLREEPATVSPDDFEVPGGWPFKSPNVFGTLTPKERVVLETDPDTAPQATQEKIKESERRALERLRKRSHKSEET